MCCARSFVLAFVEMVWLVVLGLLAVANGEEAEYSAFSGLVAPVMVGAPAQRVRMSLAFLNDESIIFHRLACPPFVLACFDQEVSETFEPDLVDPGAHFGGFLAGEFPTNRRNELAIGCDESFAFHITMGNGIAVTVPMEPVQEQDGFGCYLRAAIGHEESLVVGKHLIRSTDAVLIDNAKQRIQLVPATGAVHWAEELSVPMVPVFAEPTVDDSDGTIEITFGPYMGEAGLVLAWERPLVNGEVTLWRFIRTRLAPLVEDLSLPVGGGQTYVHSDSFVHGFDGSLRLHLLPSAHPPRCVTTIDHSPLWIDVKIVNTTPLDTIRLSVGEAMDLDIEFQGLDFEEIRFGPVAFENLDLPSPQPVPTPTEQSVGGGLRDLS